jgi:plastocyanin
MVRQQWRTLPLLLAAFALGSILLVACIRPGTASTGGSSSSSSSAASSCPSGTTVKTGTNDFEQTCITLAKGASLTVTPDQASLHILDYGQWNGNSAVAASPTGAPALKDLQVASASVTIGPFTTAGTYHIYCTVHPGMNLEVVVK